jgi:single-strand DNA-binding protein
VAKLSVAVNRSWKTETGEQREEATFVDVDAFGRQAEVIGQYFRKGRPIMIEGRLRLDTWEDKQTNQKRSRLGVVLESFQFLDHGGGRGSETEAGGAPRGRPRPRRPRRAGAVDEPSGEPQGRKTFRSEGRTRVKTQFELWLK